MTTPLGILGYLLAALLVYAAADLLLGAIRAFWRDFRRIARHDHQEDQR